MKKILLIEDDQFVRDSIRTTLSDMKYQVIEAPNGNVAKQVYLSQIDNIVLVVSDTRMPHCSGPEFLEWLREKKSQVPVVLISVFPNPLNAQQMDQLRVAAFLSKPFSKMVLQDIVNKFVPTETPKIQPAPVEDQTSEYCRIKLEEFVSAKDIDYPIFLKLNNKFIRIAHSGGKIDQLQMARFKSNGLEFLWVKKSDFHKVIGFNLILAKAAAKTNTVNDQKKKSLIRLTGETILEKAFVDGIDKRDFEYARDFMTLNLEIVCQDDEAFNILSMLQGHSDTLYAYSLGVSMYSVLLAKKLGWTSSTNLAKLGLCGMFHDIGKKEIDKSILEKPRNLLTPTEIKLLESHTIRGRDILIQLKHLPTEVAEVSYQHHEMSHGGGYPNGLAENEIHPYAKIISPICRFCELCIPNYQGRSISAKEALDKMRFSKNDYSAEVFDALTSMMSVKNVA
jgi:response regulator RpfG family c-di-GMP phosphodiesterase